MLKWPRVCDKIIEANGVKVPDFNFRSGRRLRRSDDNAETAGELRKTKARSIDRIATVPCELISHPGLKDQSCFSAVQMIEGQRMLTFSTLMTLLEYSLRDFHQN